MSDRVLRDNTGAAIAASHRAGRQRLEIVDAVRGLAIAGVVLFHLVWDLAYLRLIPSEVAFNPLWLFFGRTLAGTFMVLVGVSLVLASRNGLRRRPFVRRLCVIVACALAITVATRLVFPETFVYFGILHAIAAASIVGAALLPLGAFASAAMGLVIIVLGYTVTFATFDPRWLAWTGFALAPPFSNDLVPVFPWVGFTLLGMAFTKLALERGWTTRFEKKLEDPPARSLVWLGRHSLVIYLAHQPVLLGVLIGILRLVG